MRKIVIAIVVALALTVAGVAAGTTLAPRTAKLTLPARVAKMEGQIKVLNRRVRRAESRLACLRWQGLSSFGDPQGQQYGYVYSHDAGATTELMSAVDFDDGSDGPPQMYAVEIPQKCAIGAGGRSSLSVPKLRTAFPSTLRRAFPSGRDMTAERTKAHKLAKR